MMDSLVPQNLQISQEFNFTYILFIIVLGYILRIVYIKYIEPRIKEGKVPKINFSLKDIVKQLEIIVRLMLYAFAIFFGITTLTFASTMPETTIEVPAKLLLMFMSLVLLYTLMMLSYLIKS